jgi:AcrR family transcriptional regulator
MASSARQQWPNRAARRADARDRLLDATAALLAHGGSFSSLSVERLATKAGMSRATFYIHFESKGELVRAWYERTELEAAAVTATWWALDGEVTHEQVHTLLSGIMQVWQNHGPLLAAVQDMAAHDPLLRDSITASYVRDRDDLCHHIVEGQKNGHIDRSLLPYETSAWLSSMVERVAREAVPTADAAEIADLLDAGADILWNTLYAPTL